MRLPQLFLWLLTLVTTIHTLSLPSSLDSFSEASQSLWKRKGGGGGRGGGSGGSSGGGSSSGGSSSGGGSSGGGRGSTGSNSGGRTTTGSGAPRSFAGGSYAGGASVPYRAGATSNRGIAPVFLGVGALAFFPGIYLYGAYAYGYGAPWHYRNYTSNRNETYPATCICEATSSCGCDDNNSTDFQNQVANNQTVSRVANVNGTDTLVINGTLPNGTTADGGDEDPYGGSSGGSSGAVMTGAASFGRDLSELSGWWVVLAGVTYTLWLM